MKYSTKLFLAVVSDVSSASVFAQLSFTDQTPDLNGGDYYSGVALPSTM